MKRIFFIMTLTAFLLISCSNVEPPTANDDENTVPPQKENTYNTVTVEFPQISNERFFEPVECAEYSISEVKKLPIALVEFDYTEQDSDYAMLAFCDHTLKDANSVYYNLKKSNPSVPIEHYYAYKSYPLYTEPIGDDEFYREYFHKDILVYSETGKSLTYENEAVYVLNSNGEKTLCVNMPENTQIEQFVDGRYIVFTAFETPFFATYIYDIVNKSTFHVADLITNPIISPCLNYIVFASASESNFNFATQENGLDMMASGFYVYEINHQTCHFYAYPVELMPNAELKALNWILPSKTDIDKLCVFGNIRHEPELEEFFSQYDYLNDDDYYVKESIEVNVEPIVNIDSTPETNLINHDDFDFGRYLPLLSYVKDGKKCFSIVSNDNCEIGSSQALYDELNDFYGNQGQVIYASQDLRDAVILNGDKYIVIHGEEKAEGVYNGEAPEYLINLCYTKNKKYYSGRNGEIINQHNTRYVIDQATYVKKYQSVGEAYINWSHIKNMKEQKAYKLFTPKSYSYQLSDGSVEVYEASTIFFDGIWQILDVKTKSGKQALYSFSLSTEELVPMAKNAYEPNISQDGRYLSYKDSPDADGLYIKNVINGNAVYYPANGYEDISVVAWIDTYILHSYCSQRKTIVLLDNPDATESVINELSLDIPKYTVSNIVKPEEFNFGKYIPFVSFSISRYTVSGSTIQSRALLGSKIQTLDQGRALYDKFNNLFVKEYPSANLPFADYFDDESHYQYQLAYDMFYKSRVMHISEDGRTVGNLSLLFSESNRGKNPDSLYSVDWDSKYEMITNGKTESVEYTVMVDYQDFYHGTGYDLWLPRKEPRYHSDLAGDSWHYDDINGYRAYEVSTDTHTSFLIYSLDDLNLKYKLSLPKTIVLNGVESDAYYDIDGIRDDGKLLLYVSARDNDALKYCSMLLNTADNSYTVLENYAYQSMLSPDGKYLAYTSPVYDFDPYHESNGLFDMADGYYIKNLEDNTTVFYLTEPYYWANIVGWVDEESICQQIGGYEPSEFEERIASYRDYEAVFLENNDSAEIYDITLEDTEEATNLKEATTVEYSEFDFGEWGLSFFYDGEGVLLTNGVSDVTNGKIRYAELNPEDEIYVSYSTYPKYGQISDKVKSYEDNIVYRSGFYKENFTYVFSKSRKRLSYTVKLNDFSIDQVNDDFFVLKTKLDNNTYKLTLVDIKTKEQSSFLSDYYENIVSPDRKYVFSYNYSGESVRITNLENKTAVFYASTQYYKPKWINLS